MKKTSKIVILILAVFLVASLCVSLVACDPSGGDNGENNNPNSYENPIYTVTFKTNSDMVLTNSVVKVENGNRVDEPRDASGQKIIPVKRGNEFLFWSEDGSNPFDFSQGITKNTTITAQYKARVYKHTPELTSTLKYDEQTKTFSVEETRDINDVGLSDAELNPDTTTLLSTFNSANDKLPCPTGNDRTGEFCFWYYMNSDNKPVQFSKWKNKDESTVGVLNSYNFTNGLTLYPMFYDNLPIITVKFADSLSGVVYDTKEFKFGQNIPSATAPSSEKTGYDFEYWYYIVTSEDKDGKEVKEEKSFVFETVDEKEPTSPMDAAQAKDNFTPAELTLYAKWTRVIRIASLNDYKALYDELRAENLDDEQAKRREQIYTAKISIAGEIDFGDNLFEPLFDKEHPFKGTIDGNEYGSNGNVLSTAKIKGGYFGYASGASVFGYNEGVIKNIVFENIGISFDDMTADLVYIGTITSNNGGTIEGCAVIYTNELDLAYTKGIVYGAITATNNGTASANALIRSCTVNVVGGFTAECKSLVFGGVAGEGNASASITKTTVVRFDVSSVLCQDSSSSSASLVMGGIVGINAGQIRLSTVRSFEVADVTSLNEFVFGGVAGVNTSNLRVVNVSVKLGSAEAPVKACGSLSNLVAIGGLIGKNEGYILNSYADADLYVEIEASPQNGSIVAIGGLVGNNYSDKKDTSTASESGVCAMNYCYSMGNISVKVADGIENVTVYAGGIAGRNTHKKLGSLFSVSNISVNNGGAKNYVGKIVGKMLNDVATNGKIFFIEEVDINVVGEVETQALGTIIDEADLRNEQKVTGANGGTGVVGFSPNTWVIIDNNYPTFNEDVYKDQ